MATDHCPNRNNMKFLITLIIVLCCTLCWADDGSVVDEKYGDDDMKEQSDSEINVKKRHISFQPVRNTFGYIKRPRPMMIGRNPFLARIMSRPSNRPKFYMPSRYNNPFSRYNDPFSRYNNPNSRCNNPYSRCNPSPRYYNRPTRHFSRFPQ
ncbi:uncharacterized protein LOC111636677 isoform X2 [Centruroides sculpturatus]|uniref:uncharacterized protein LOC111636677 isoform X2 n=1 Tax=Centruroides sculpturatus TaxID=218467 RepID=UPI000C6D4BE4|nr:uncharacterized protein LOC111636677 isoform X2 [Centruroides sculpturatus]